MLSTANSRTHAETHMLSASSSGSRSFGAATRESAVNVAESLVVMTQAHFLICEVINVLNAVINHVVQHR